MKAFDISVFECIWCLNGLEVILEPAAGTEVWYDSDNFHRNVINVEHTASPVWLFLASFAV